MKGFPRTIATGADLLNCLALVQTGELKAADLAAAVAAIEEREYITLPILEMSDDRKTVVVADCGELAAGVSVENNSSTTINNVERPEPEATAATPDAVLSGGGKIKGALIMNEVIEGGAELVPAETDPATPEPESEAAQLQATVTLSRALPSGTTTLRILAPHDPFEEIGTTRQKIAAIKEVLTQYE